MENNQTPQAIYFNQVLASILNSPLYLILCILMSAECSLGLFTGGFSVLKVLLIVFLWILFGAAKSGAFLDAQKIKPIHTIVNVEFILNFVIAGLFVLLSGLCFLAALLCSNEKFNLYSLQQYLSTDDYMEIIDALQDLREMFGSFEEIDIALWVVFAIVGIGLAVIGVLVLLYNLLFVAKVKDFVYSIYKSAEFNSFYLRKVNAVRNWLLAMAIISGISSFSVTEMPFTDFAAEPSYFNIFDFFSSITATFSSMLTAGVFVIAFIIVKTKLSPYYIADAEIPTVTYNYPTAVNTLPVASTPVAKEVVATEEVVAVEEVVATEEAAQEVAENEEKPQEDPTDTNNQ